MDICVTPELMNINLQREIDPVQEQAVGLIHNRRRLYLWGKSFIHIGFERPAEDVLLECMADSDSRTLSAAFIP
jgi:hypothetical protein